jgi:hypothetical protein
MVWFCALVLVTISCLPCWGAGKAKGGDLSGADITWFYGYYGQMGPRGFFGDYNLDASSTGGNFASLNAWVGNQTDINSLATGSNAAYSAFGLDLKPEYGNQWVMLKARYTITPYVTSSSQGAVAVISPQNLTSWEAQVNTPVADITVGKQVFRKGFDLQFSSNRTSEYLLVEKSYCVPDILARLVCCGILPRKIMSWFNPEFWPRFKPPPPDTNASNGKPPEPSGPPDPGTDPEYDFFGGDPTTGESVSKRIDNTLNADTYFNEILTDNKEETDRKTRWPNETDAFAWGQTGPGCLRIGFGFFPWETPIIPSIPPTTTNLGFPYFTLWNNFDLGANQVQNFLGFLQYNSTDLEFGVGCLRSNYHQGPELQLGLANRISAPTFERYITEGWAYLKFNNGRYFFNTELDWFNRVHRFQRSLNGTFFGTPDNIDGSGSVFASKYWESWRYMAEIGGLFGPIRASLFYCFMPGPDRRHGIYIDRQPFIQENLQQAFGLFDPYSMVLSYRFGSGVNAPGHISDASAFAVRLEYALAANLLVHGSYLYAYRNSHGYAMGFVRPNITVAAGKFGQVVYAEPPGSTFTNPAPSIPDRHLGWEAMAGITWELMDGWPVSVQVSYWQPGRWFNYACIDKGVINWDIPSPANNWGVRPDRVIDPVLAVEVQLGATF